MRKFFSLREYVTDKQIGLTSLKTLKVGEGIIAQLEISMVKKNSVVTLYDNIASSGNILWSSGTMTDKSIPFIINLGGVYFNIGLSLSITGADSTVTTLYA
jgi:hypothetical protein